MSVTEQTYGDSKLTYNTDGSLCATVHRYIGQYGGCVAIEEGTTNLIPVNYQKFAGWTARNNAVITLTQNTSVPEYNVTDATRVQISGGDQVYKYSYTILNPTVSGQAYTASVWVKNTGSNSVIVQLYPSSDLSAQILPGQTKRVTTTATGDGTNSLQIRFRTVNISDSLDFITWHPQVESKSFATSFTTSTRQAGILSYQPSIFNQSEFTIYMGINVDSLTSSTSIRLFQVDDGSNVAGHRYLGLYNTSTKQIVFYVPNANGNSDQTITLNCTLDQQWHTIAFVRSAGKLRVHFDGQFVESNISEPAKLNPTRFYIGSLGTLYQANMLVDELLMLKRAAITNEIQTWQNLNAPFYDPAETFTDDRMASAANWNASTTNFNSRNDRKATIPANPTILTDGTAIDHTINTDGSADISFEWQCTGTGDAYDIDGFIIYSHASSVNSTYTFGTSPATENVYFVASDKRAFILNGVAANLFYTFGVQAYRNVDQDISSTGMLKSSIIKSTATGENPYQPSTSVAFNGDITGTVSGTSASTVAGNATSAYNGTTNYRTTGVPTNNPTPGTVTVIQNANGTINIHVEWDKYTQGAKQADLLMLFWKSGSTIGLGSPSVTDATISFNVNTSGTSYYDFEGVAPKFYSVSIAAARRTENGLEIGSIQSPTSWQNINATQATHNAGDVPIVVSNYFELNKDHMITYDSNGESKFNVNFNTGDAYFGGTLKAGIIKCETLDSRLAAMFNSFGPACVVPNADNTYGLQIVSGSTNGDYWLTADMDMGISASGNRYNNPHAANNSGQQLYGFIHWPIQSANILGTVTSATIILYNTYTSNGSMFVQNAVSSWDESSQLVGATTLYKVGYVSGGFNYLTDSSLINQVKSWVSGLSPNHGIRLAADTGQSFEFSGREDGDSGKWPKLHITTAGISNDRIVRVSPGFCKLGSFIYNIPDQLSIECPANTNKYVILNVNPYTTTAYLTLQDTNIITSNAICLGYTQCGLNYITNIDMSRSTGRRDGALSISAFGVGGDELPRSLVKAPGIWRGSWKYISNNSSATWIHNLGTSNLEITGQYRSTMDSVIENITPPMHYHYKYPAGVEFYEVWHEVGVSVIQASKNSVTFQSAKDSVHLSFPYGEIVDGFVRPIIRVIDDHD